MVVSCVTCHCGAKGSWCLLVTSRSFFCEVGGRRGQRINKPTSCRVWHFLHIKWWVWRFILYQSEIKRNAAAVYLHFQQTLPLMHFTCSSPLLNQLSPPTERAVPSAHGSTRWPHWMRQTPSTAQGSCWWRHVGLPDSAACGGSLRSLQSHQTAAGQTGQP